MEFCVQLRQVHQKSKLTAKIWFLSLLLIQDHRFNISKLIIHKRFSKSSRNNSTKGWPLFLKTAPKNSRMTSKPHLMRPRLQLNWQIKGMKMPPLLMHRICLKFLHPSFQKTTIPENLLMLLLPYPWF